MWVKSPVSQSRHENFFFSLLVVSQDFHLCYALGSCIPSWEVDGICFTGAQVSKCAPLSRVGFLTRD